MITRKQINDIVNAILKMRKDATDETAIAAQALYPEWKSDRLEDGEVYYSIGDRVRYNDNLYKCITEHIPQEDWTPENAPSLWAKVLPGQDGEIGEWAQPGSTNPYMNGDKVMHNGFVWISVIDNNVWEPGVYGWTKQE